MSHQTGIKAGSELKDVFRQCTIQNDIRLVKVSIVNESLVPSETVNIRSSNWREDYDRDVLPLLEDKKPCYLFFRLNSADEWLFIAYTPDGSKIREKMLYSGTRSTLKQEFGGGLIIDELIGTSVNEVTLKGYDEYKKAESAPPPLTDAEEELMAVKKESSNTEINVTTRHQTVQGLAFPLTNELVTEINKFRQGQVNYLQLSIDIDNENIFLSQSGNVSPGDLEQAIPAEEAHYHIYRYDHVFHGTRLESLVFVYTMPGYSVSIKARMLYSSCKGPLLDGLTAEFGLEFDKRLEVDRQNITEAFLMEELHPPVVEKKEMFLKPKAPGRRGSPRRVVSPKE